MTIAIAGQDASGLLRPLLVGSDGSLGTDARAFRALPTSTVSIAATTTTGSVAISGLTAGGQVRVANGVGDVRIEFGTSGVTATAASLIVRAGSVEMFSVPSGTTHVAAKTDSSTTTVEFTPGTGV